MKVWLKRLTIICIIMLVIMSLYNIFEDVILPRMYSEKTDTNRKVSQDDVYNMCNNAVIKYFTSLRQDINNIKYFMPSSIRSSKNTKVYKEKMDDIRQITTYDIYKVTSNIYKIEYSLKDDYKEKFVMIIKFNEKRNYYKVLYDEQYKKG